MNDHKQGKRRLLSGGSLAGFSLVELLVSVCVVGVLAALVFGGLPKVLASSQSAKCLHNLRTLSQACLGYAAENNNNLPFRYSPGAGWGGYGDPLWYVAIAPYADVDIAQASMGELESPGPFRCPADKVPWVGGTPGQYRPSCSYAFPINLAYYNGAGVVNSAGSFTGLAGRISRPSESVMLIDSAFGNVFNSGNFATAGPASNDPAENGPQLIKRHPGYLNAVFVDGHTERIPGNTPSYDPKRPYLWGHQPN